MWSSKVSSKEGHSWVGQKGQTGNFSGQLGDVIIT